jgi:hypothetical protein
METIGIVEIIPNSPISGASINLDYFGESVDE